MTYTEPLALETWMVNIFAGNPDIFGAIALIAIAALAGYFRLSGIGLFFMLTMFLIMFSGYIGSNLLILVSIVGGLLIGYWISRLVK